MEPYWAVGLDSARIEEIHMVGRVFRGQSVQFEAGKLAFPVPKGWQFDRGEITWTTKDGQTYLKVPIIKTEV